VEIKLNPIYSGICPICGREADAESIIKHNMCTRCFSEKQNVPGGLLLHKYFEEELEDFEEVFEKLVGHKPWGAQKTWAKRLLDRENTVIIAPTGMGKTTLLLVYSIYSAARYGRKILYLTPTRALARQVYSKLHTLASKLRKPLYILIYDSSASKKAREEVLSSMRTGQFDILILTNNFMVKNTEIILSSGIDIVVIDDVDSLLKSDKNVKKLLKLIGYNESIVEKVKEKHRILWRALFSKAMNREDLYEEYIRKLVEIEAELEELTRTIEVKQVVIASATGKMRGIYAKILRDLLRVDISGITVYGRNVTDTFMYIDHTDSTAIYKVIEKLGPGGLILVSPRHPFKDSLVKIAKNIETKLVSSGYRVGYAEPGSIEKLVEGKLDFIIGSSSYYGVSVRGIDAPRTIKYVIFLGTPVFTLDLGTMLASPKILIRAALYLYETTMDEKYRKIALDIRNKVFSLTPGEIKILSMLLRGRLELEDVENAKIKEIYSELREYYNTVSEKIKEIVKAKTVVDMGTITFYYSEKNRKWYAVIPDALTYIQASGRTSRLYLGRMTHGFSLVVEYKVFENLVKSLDLRLGFYTNTKLFKPIEAIDLNKEARLIEETREKLEKGGIKYRNILVIVESPTKAKTIARFFGKPVRRRIGSLNVYEIPFIKNEEIIHLNVIATRGHIYDLTTDPNVANYGIDITEYDIMPRYETIKKCRICGYQFTYGTQCPRCGSKTYVDSAEVVNALRKLAGEANEVYIATDPDIEGEKIAYDVYLAIKGFNNNVWRIELHEITAKEFINALTKRRSIDYKLVEAEIYRRVLDRLIGFSLSHNLWRKYGKNWLGAGRVQTPVLGWIIERYKKYLENKCRKIVYRLTSYPGIHVSTCIPVADKELYNELLSATKAELILKEKRDELVKPKPPYTTDELLSDASKLGLPASKTMKIAQELFELGLITYHRTSNHYVSSTGISIATKYLEAKGWSSLARPSHWGEHGAHEAIRPVYPLDPVDLEKAVTEGVLSLPIPLTKLHYRVYGLIFKRFIASQMKPYRILKHVYSVYVGRHHIGDLVLGIRVLEDGFNVVSKPRIYPELENVDTVCSGVEVVFKTIASKVKLYSEGELVHRMKNEKLGRPSTYAKIIDNLIRHGYTIRSKKIGYLIPTKTGIEVYDYLAGNYPDLVSTATTQVMEEYVDRIACGELSAAHAILGVVEVIEKHNLPLSSREAVFSTSS